jgi:hypothetical protein
MLPPVIWRNIKGTSAALCALLDARQLVRNTRQSLGRRIAAYALQKRRLDFSGEQSGATGMKVFPVLRAFPSQVICVAFAPLPSPRAIASAHPESDVGDARNDRASPKEWPSPTVHIASNRRAICEHNRGLICIVVSCVFLL